MSRLLAYVVAALVAITVTLSFGLWRSVAANGSLRAERDGAKEALNQAQEAQKRTEGILAQVRAEKRSTGLQSARTAEALKRAQEASPEWAATPTPPEVQKALTEALEGLQ